jgi:glycerate dehydrogenase
MDKPKVVFLDAATYGSISLTRFLERWNCTVHQVTQPWETADRLKGHAIAISNKVAIDQTVFASIGARELKLIAVAATGTDIIDREAAVKYGVQVCNVPGYATQSVAQFTMALMLALATGVHRYARAVRNGDWQKSPVFALLDYPGVELRGKTLGIVGYGNIGQTVGQMARAFGMNVLVAARPGAGGPLPPGRMPIEKLLPQADVISLHCPLTPQTARLINRSSLALMKATAFLINTARGALVDEEALIQALRDRRLAAAAVDVISREPPTPNDRMVVAAAELGNLIVTPHTAWSALETRERLLWEVEQNVSAFLDGRERNRVA